MNNNKKYLYPFIGTVLAVFVVWLLSFPYNNLNDNINKISIDITFIKADVVDMKLEMRALRESSNILLETHEKRLDKLERP